MDLRRGPAPKAGSVSRRATRGGPSGRVWQARLFSPPRCSGRSTAGRCESIMAASCGLLVFGFARGGARVLTWEGVGETSSFFHFSGAGERERERDKK